MQNTRTFMQTDLQQSGRRATILRIRMRRMVARRPDCWRSVCIKVRVFCILMQVRQAIFVIWFSI